MFTKHNIKQIQNAKLSLLLLSKVLLFVIGVTMNSPVKAEAAPEPLYDLSYQFDIQSDCTAQVSIKIDRDPEQLKSFILRLRIDPNQHFDFKGKGVIKTEEGSLTWHTPDGKGILNYRVKLNHERKPGKFDARCTKNWALFRCYDLFPGMSVKTPKGVPIMHTQALLRIKTPNGWSVVTPFPKNKKGLYVIEQPHRLHDRPTGWILAGKIATTRNKYKGVSITIASPKGEGVRRLDMLALLRWTLPTLKKIIPTLPERLLIVSAGDPMWRGALSGPGSIYIHADRPLISFDGTSPLLHELIHVVTHAKSADNGDWVVEGMAEYYSLELLRRSRTISKRRYEKAHKNLEKKGSKVKKLLVKQAKGKVTARAVAVMRQIDELLRKETKGKAGLDDVLRLLSTSHDPVTTERFRKIVEQIIGHDMGKFFSKHVGEPPYITK